MEQRRKIGGMTLHFPRDIRDTSFNEKSGALSLHLTCPQSNMQENPAAFEGWCLVLKANGAFDKVELSFDPVNINKESFFHNLRAEQQHYLRFLYRVSKFRNQFGRWFSVSAKNQNELDFFETSFNNVRKVNTPPDSASRYDAQKGKEHVLEKAFVRIPTFRQKVGIPFIVHDQFPSGIFLEQVAKKHQIFNTGYFDLWGVNGDCELYIFELKEPGNRKVGVISELYFYANLAQDLFFERNGFHLSRVESDFRGYQTALGFQKNQIHGVFLVPHFHTEIERVLSNVLDMLNSNSEIKYSALKFDWSGDLHRELQRELSGPS